MLRPLALALAVFLAAGPLSHSTAHAAEPLPDPAVLAQLRDAALQSNWAFSRLTDLTEGIGGRLSGSPQAEAAVAQVAAALRAENLKVTLDPVMVPHWVRGEERAELTAYPGQVAGFSQHLVLTTLGGSSATPPEGISAQVLVVTSLEDLQRKAPDVPGKIVLFNVPFDVHLEENGLAGRAYGQAAEGRFVGPAAAQRLGAVAALVRSVTGAAYRLPHTGATVTPKDQQAVPSAAITIEDAELISRLAARGPVTVHLVLTPQTLPDVASANVIAEIPGSDLKDEIVLVSGHLDSWDLAQGALDDGAGVTAAMGAIQIIAKLHLKPRRTIRFVAWMNEENGSRGMQGYTQAHRAEFERHVAVIESDLGAGRPLGIEGYLTAADAKRLGPVTQPLRVIGAGILTERLQPLGSDLGDLEDAGAPGFEPLVDARTYFDYHHTAADTLDKIDPENLRRQVAVLAVLTYYLADTPLALERMASRP